MSRKPSNRTRLRLPRRLATASGKDSSSNTPADGNRDYEVGFCRPPKHTRFKPGESGNPKGKAARSRNVKTIVTQILDEPMSIKEGDRVRKVTRFEALVRLMVSRAFKGDPKAFSILAVMMKHVGYGSEAGQDLPELPPGVDYEAILREFLARNEDVSSDSSSSDGQSDQSDPQKKGKA